MTTRQLLVRALPMLCAGVLVAVCAAPSGAQRTHRAAMRRANSYGYANGAGDTQQLSPVQATHQTLQSAIQAMESALPIYDGHRHRAIELARLAQLLLGQAATEAGMGARRAQVRRLSPA